MNRFEAEFEINASKKMLYPYISSASGLSQWFADDVTINEDKVYTFVFDNENNKARMAGHRTNNFARFEFLPENGEEDPPWFELRLEMNELTETVFLHIVDYTDIDDDEELQAMWETMVDGLREIVGG